jgi:hypothetical protein
VPCGRCRRGCRHDGVECRGGLADPPRRHRHDLWPGHRLALAAGVHREASQSRVSCYPAEDSNLVSGLWNRRSASITQVRHPPPLRYQTGLPSGYRSIVCAVLSFTLQPEGFGRVADEWRADATALGDVSPANPPAHPACAGKAAAPSESEISPPYAACHARLNRPESRSLHWTGETACQQDE